MLSLYESTVVASPKSVIALIMRHPFQWYYKFGHDAKQNHRKGTHIGLVAPPHQGKRKKRSIEPNCFIAGGELCAQLWLDLFGRVLGDLAAMSSSESGRLWTMIRFEALLTSPHQTLQETLLALGLDADIYPYASISHSQTSLRRRQRILGYRASDIIGNETVKVDKRYFWHVKVLAPGQSRHVADCHIAYNSKESACCQLVTLVQAVFGYDLVAFDQSNVTEAVSFSSGPTHRVKLENALLELGRAGLSDKHFLFSTSSAHASCFSKTG